MGKKDNLKNSLQKNMKYVAAYCLLALAGNENPSEADLKKVLTGSGCEVNNDSVKAVVDALKGKQLHEVINAGFGKIASLSVGSGGGSAGQQTAPTEAKAEAKKEEKKEEVVEEEEEDMDLGDLFG